MLDLKNIIDKSGDSILEEYSYSGGFLTIILDMSELERKINIRIRTDNLSFNNNFLEREEEYRTCRIEIQKLLDVLLVENNIYIPSNSFGKLVNESRLNYNLAYGKKCLAIRYIFSLVGYGILVSCLLSDLTCISIEEE